jgi:hypothetical protein
LLQIGFAPGAVQAANLPLASLQRTGLGGGHLMNLPLASLHGGAAVALDAMALKAIVLKDRAAINTAMDRMAVSL